MDSSPDRGESSSDSINITTAEDLAELLQDEAFVDYFNVFLSLPIFSQRLFYKNDDKDFEFDPPIQRTRYILDRSKVVTWLMEDRIPLFRKTDLFVEFVLCKLLVESRLHISPSSHRLDYEEHRITEDYLYLQQVIGSVIGMCHFRHFLSDTNGAVILQFWMDTERFFRIEPEDAEARWKAFREIQLKYFKLEGFSENGAQEVLADGTGLIKGDPWRQSNQPKLGLKFSDRAIDRFLADDKKPNMQEVRLSHLKQLQEVVLTVLKKYWFQKYMIHVRPKNEKQLPKRKSQRDMRSRSTMDKTLDNIDKAMGFGPKKKQEGSATVETRARMTWRALFPGHVVDDNFLLDSDEVITLHDNGSVTVDKLESNEIDKMLGSFSTSYSSEESSDADSKPKPSPVKSPRKVDFMLQTGKRKSRKKSANLVQKIAKAEQQKASWVNVSPSKEEIIKKGKIELEKIQNAMNQQPVAEEGRPETCPATLHLTWMEQQRDKANKWKAATAKPDVKELTAKSHSKLFAIDDETRQLLKIYQEIPEADQTSCYHPCAQVSTHYWEARPMFDGCFRTDNAIFILAIAADCVSGGPFQDYLMKEKLPQQHKQLCFWKEAQEYVTTQTAQSQLIAQRLRFRRAKLMIEKLLRLQNLNNPDLSLPPGLTNMLQQLIPQEKGVDLLRHAQDFASQSLKRAWKDFGRYDKSRFIECVTYRRKRKSKQSMPGKGGMSAQCTTRTHAGESVFDFEEDLEDEQSMITERRQTRGLQLALDICGCGLGPEVERLALPIDPVPFQDLKFDPEQMYGSLEVKEIIVHQRQDLIDERERWLQVQAMRRQALILAESLAARELDNKLEDYENMPFYIRPFRQRGNIYHRPPKPNSFTEVLRCDLQSEFFRRYLCFHNADTPMLFYMSVEEVKKCRDNKTKLLKIKQIVRRYFSEDEDIDLLDCNVDVVREIPNMEKVTLSILFSAQTSVALSLEEKWFESYQKTFPGGTDVLQTAVKLLSDGGKRQWGKDRTKTLWTSVVRSIVQFRNCILSSKESKHFADYLKNECRKEIDKHRQTNTYVYGVPIKRLIKNKMVDVTKLVSDIHFLAEADRYLTMCDDAMKAAKAGNDTEHEAEMIERKARMILECYIDSELPPRLQTLQCTKIMLSSRELFLTNRNQQVRTYHTICLNHLQINISKEIAENTIIRFENGYIDRALFHDACISLYPMLVYLWKKFLKCRFSRMYERFEEKQKQKSAVSFTIPDYINIDINAAKKMLSLHDEDCPRLLFSLYHGIRLFLPRRHLDRGNRVRPSVFYPTETPSLRNLMSRQLSAKASHVESSNISLRKSSVAMSSPQQRRRSYLLPPAIKEGNGDDSRHMFPELQSPTKPRSPLGTNHSKHVRIGSVRNIKSKTVALPPLPQDQQA